MPSTFPFTPPIDDWFHIVPIGEFDHASGVRQVVDQHACEAMTNHFNRESSEPNFPGLLVDFDHFSHSSDKTSAAAGWITALRADPPACPDAATTRPPGLWAQIRWSDLGEAALHGGRYRLVSPVWNREDCEAVDGNETKVRPLRLSRLALTNDPNLKGLVPLTNRTEPKESMTDYKTKLLNLLALEANATDSQIDEAIRSRTEEVATLRQRCETLLAHRVEEDLREFATVINDVDSVRSQLLANRESTLATLRALHLPQPNSHSTPTPASPALPAGEPKPALHNRHAARTPDSVVPASTLTADETRARRIANRAREIQKQLGVGHTQAFQLARGEIAST